jgi:hypothetical protein
VTKKLLEEILPPAPAPVGVGTPKRPTSSAFVDFSALILSDKQGLFQN